MRVWGEEAERVEVGQTGGEGNWLQRGDTQLAGRMVNKEESGDCCGFSRFSLEIKIPQVSQTSFDRRSPCLAMPTDASELPCWRLRLVFSCLCALSQLRIRVSLPR